MVILYLPISLSACFLLLQNAVAANLFPARYAEVPRYSESFPCSSKVLLGSLLMGPLTPDPSITSCHIAIGLPLTVPRWRLSFVSLLRWLC